MITANILLNTILVLQNGLTNNCLIVPLLNSSATIEPLNTNNSIITKNDGLWNLYNISSPAP